MFLKQSTAFTDRIGPFLDKTDGVTEETGLTTAAAAIFLSPNGGNFVAKNESTALSHDQDGWYVILYDATDTATVGKLVVMVQAPATHLPVWVTYWVLEEDIYEALFAASAAAFDSNDRVDVGAVLGTAQTAGDLAALLSDIKTATVIASGTVETSGSNSSTQVQTDLAEATNNHYNDGTILFTSGAEAGQWRTIGDYVGSTGVISWEDALTGTPADSVTFVLIPVGTSAHAVWETLLTGSTHNTATSAGRRLREVAEVAILASGEIVTVTDGRTITLDTGAVGTADFYIGQRLEIEEGTGAGQTRIIVAYSAARVCLLDSPFTTNPDTNSLYAIAAGDVHVSVSDSDLAEGLVATATSTTTITLDSGALANADFYNEMLIIFTHGTGAGQASHITAYTVGRVVTMSPALDVALSTDTVYHIQAAVPISQFVKEVWDEAMVASTGAPAITGSMRAFMEWWATLSRNVVNQTATTTTVRNDADDGDISTSTVSDDGSEFVRGKFST